MKLLIHPSPIWGWLEHYPLADRFKGQSVSQPVFDSQASVTSGCHPSGPGENYGI